VLVAALLIVAILMLMAMTLAYNMSSYLRMVGSVRAKSQDYYSSLGGVDRTRTFLGSNLNGANFNIWGGLLTGGTGTYRNVTQIVTSSIIPPFVPGVSGSTYQIFIKDNDDGDGGNFASDNDQLVLATVVARNDARQTTSTVEAMLIFDQSVLSEYAQGGGGVNKANRSKGAGPAVSMTQIID